MKKNYEKIRKELTLGKATVTITEKWWMRE